LSLFLYLPFSSGAHTWQNLSPLILNPYSFIFPLNHSFTLFFFTFLLISSCQFPSLPFKFLFFLTEISQPPWLHLVETHIQSLQNSTLKSSLLPLKFGPLHNSIQQFFFFLHLKIKVQLDYNQKPKISKEWNTHSQLYSLLKLPKENIQNISNQYLQYLTKSHWKSSSKLKKRSSLWRWRLLPQPLLSLSPYRLPPLFSFLFFSFFLKFLTFPLFFTVLVCIFFFLFYCGN